MTDGIADSGIVLMDRGNRATSAGAQLVTVRERSHQSISGAEWDTFAGRCGASHHCAFDHIRLWHLFGPVRYCEIFLARDGVSTKVGQCAVAIGRRSRRFLDGLQLLPEAGDLWSSAMAMVLEVLGPGRYRYGSHWNLERPRDQDSLKIPDVRVDRVVPVTLQAVDFSQWTCWEHYARALSENVRRNARRATKAYPGLGLVISRGVQTVTRVQQLIWFRALMFRRKNLHFRIAREWIRALVRAVIWRKHVVMASAVAENATLSMFSGITFGANCYYLEGASRVSNRGASWYLMVNMLRLAYERSPTGKFVMGVVQDDSDLARSRLQCRVSQHPSCVLYFTYKECK